MNTPQIHPKSHLASLERVVRQAARREELLRRELDAYTAELAEHDAWFIAVTIRTDPAEYQQRQTRQSILTRVTTRLQGELPELAAKHQEAREALQLVHDAYIEKCRAIEALDDPNSQLRRTMSAYVMDQLRIETRAWLAEYVEAPKGVAV